MKSNDSNREIAVVNQLNAEEVRVAELAEELIDIEEHARQERPVPHVRNYRIKIDGTYHVVYSPEIAGEEILRLAGHQSCLVFEVIQHFRGGREEVIAPHAKVNLRSPGIERFATAAKMVEVSIDTRKVRIQVGSYTLAELKVALSVEPGKVLDEVVGGEFRELTDNRRIHIKGGEIFVSHVRTGKSS
jgi:hypothetical protein